MEADGAAPNVVQMHYHFGSSNTTFGGAWAGPNFTAGWHTFAVDWEPGSIHWYVDGVLRLSFTQAAAITNLPMYLVLNLAMAGPAQSAWHSVSGPGTPPTGDMQVAWVRVWQH
jgi:beta-glucanase (GH16 family)